VSVGTLQRTIGDDDDAGPLSAGAVGNLLTAIEEGGIELRRGMGPGATTSITTDTRAELARLITGDDMDDTDRIVDLIERITDLDHDADPSDLTTEAAAVIGRLATAAADLDELLSAVTLTREVIDALKGNIDATDHVHTFGVATGGWADELPTWGDEPSGSTDGVWSWDATRLLIGEGWGNWELVDREDLDAD
jgi:hypothetical protein